jgi:hypothetical protein
VATTESGSTLSGRSKSFDAEEHRTGPPSCGEEIHESFSSDSGNLDGSKTSSDSSSTSELVSKWDKDDKGKEMKVLTKVQQRKEKFERMEKESRRRSGPYGLLKPTWKRVHPTRGLPSDAYMRTFQGNVAPKKTLAELP